MTQADMLERDTGFLFDEAEMLDRRDWDSWGALFDPEGIYWLPARTDQSDPLEEVSLIYDTPLLRRIRLERLKNDDATSLAPGVRSVHHVGNIQLGPVDPGSEDVTVRSCLMVGQWTPSARTTFHARVTHVLSFDGARLLIRHKRVDLLGAEGPLSDILTIL